MVVGVSVARQTGGLRRQRTQQRGNLPIANGAEGTISGLHDLAPGQSRVETNHTGKRNGRGESLEWGWGGGGIQNQNIIYD